MDNQSEKGTIQPKVSILLPNLNYRRFLEKRIQTVLNQTLIDWELIIVDSYSDDGAWELIQGFAKRDVRIRILQAPREGIYAGLNHCIRLARGEYIYIATSDDTMFPDCLEKMVTAMDAHPECGICHTCLKVIDEERKEIPNFWQELLPAQFYGELMNKPHIRFAPYDGILHCALYTVYTSLTQLLIRRSIFDKVGLFRTDWGSEGDFEWGMRAASVCNILHIPETLATWRIHSEQATKQINPESSARKARFCEMIKAALPLLKTNNPEFYKKIHVQRLLFLYRWEQLILGLQERQSYLLKLLFLLRFSLTRPDIVCHYISYRFLRKQQWEINRFTYIKTELKRLGLDRCIKILPYNPT